MHPELENTWSRPILKSTVVVYVMLASVLFNFVLTHVFQALTQQLTVQFIVNTKCTGGIDKNLCISPYITSSGFGNCVVITQAGKVPDLTQSKSKIG